MHLFVIFEVLTARMRTAENFKIFFFGSVPKHFYQTTRRCVTKDSVPCTHYRKNPVAQVTGF
jgi:hypothetical protein